MDNIIMEGKSPTIDPNDFRMMIASDLHRNIEQVWRVRFYENNTVSLYSFAMPAIEKNFGVQPRLNIGDIPQWVKERVAVLQICESGDIINGVGQKVSDRVFYVIE